MKLELSRLSILVPSGTLKKVISQKDFSRCRGSFLKWNLELDTFYQSNLDERS